MSFQPKAVLLTGASSGIGRALAEQLLAQGARVYGVARSQYHLSELSERYPDTFVALPFDVTKPESWTTMLSMITDPVDTVILNAGNCIYIDEGEVDAEIVKAVFEVNFFANVYAAQYLLPAWGDSLKNWVVVSSSAKFLAMPRAEAYGASKAALSYFYEALQLSYQHILFSIVHPGFVKTPLTDKNDFVMPMQVTAQQAAQSIIDGVARSRRNIQFPFIFTRILSFLGRLPSLWRYKLGLRMLKA